MNINELREQRAKCVHDMRTILESAESEKRSMSNEEKANYDKAFNDQQALKDRIDQAQRQLELDRELASQSVVEERSKSQPAKQKTDQEIRAASFAKYIKEGRSSLTEIELRALENTTKSEGGYLSPDEMFVANLIKAVDNQVFLRSLATVYTVTTADSLGVPTLENDPDDATWTTEIGTVSEDSTMSFGKRSLQPNPARKLVKVSRKLLRASAIPAEQLVRDRLAYKFAVTQEKGFMTGTGASQPLGVYTASANGISTGRDVSTGNSTTAFTVDGLKNAKYSVKGSYHGNAQWIFHRDAVLMLSKLKDGDGQYLWNQSVQVGDPDRLLGNPVNMSEYAPSTFTTGLYVGIFGDFRNYWIVDSLSMGVQRLDELYAATSQVGFIGDMESDGMPVLEEAFARVKLA